MATTRQIQTVVLALSWINRLASQKLPSPSVRVVASCREAPSNCRSSLTATYRRHENIKKRSYEQRIREVEHGSFTPLVFSASGGMAPAATITFKRLASLIAEKQQQDYNKTIAWIRCLLSFSLVRSSVMCLRGARSSYHRPAKPDFDTPLDVALSDGHVPTH